MLHLLTEHQLYIVYFFGLSLPHFSFNLFVQYITHVLHCCVCFKILEKDPISKGLAESDYQSMAQAMFFIVVQVRNEVLDQTREGWRHSTKRAMAIEIGARVNTCEAVWNIANCQESFVDNTWLIIPIQILPFHTFVDFQRELEFLAVSNIPNCLKLEHSDFCVQAIFILFPRSSLE